MFIDGIKVILKCIKMIIAIDFVGSNFGSGTKTYNLNFCNQLENSNLDNKIVIFLTKEYFHQIKFKKNQKIKYIIKSNIFSNILFRLFWMQFILPFELLYLKINKLYSPMNFCPIILRISKIKVILAIHSNLPWVHFNLMPGNFIRNFTTKKLMELSIFFCDKIIVDSHYAKKELSNILKIKKDKIEVIYLGIDEKFLTNRNSNIFLKNFNYHEKYILTVLSCVKYHNIINLLKAFKVLINQDGFKGKFILVLQIIDEEYFKYVNNYIQLNFNKNKIIILKNIDNNNLPNLYRHAELFLFTSYCEVFGLTSLEAMTQNCPVVISNQSALPEINQDSALYFDPDNIVDIKKSVEKVLKNQELKNYLITKSKLHYPKFSWIKTIEKTLEVINI